MVDHRLPAQSYVLTGCGMVTPFGAGTLDTLGQLVNFASRAAPLPTFNSISDSVLHDLPTPSGELAKSRLGRIAAAALHFAAQQGGLAIPPMNPDRVGLVLVSTQAGQGGMIQFAEEVRAQTPRFVSPIHFPETVGNYLAGALARSCGLRGPNATVSGGVNAGLEAIVEGLELIHHQASDMVFVGGCESWVSALVEEPAVELPSMAEAACFLLFESSASANARGARILSRIELNRGPTNASGNNTLHVLASGTKEGAICIQPWLGYCPSSAVALGVAAAIAASRGAAIPLTPASVDSTKMRLSGNAMVMAGPESGTQSYVRLVIPIG